MAPIVSENDFSKGTIKGPSNGASQWGDSYYQL